MDKTIGSDLGKVFCRQFVEMRKSVGMTQRELADKLGRERSFVARIELGERRVDMVEFFQICRSLDLDAAKLAADIFDTLANSGTPQTAGVGSPA